MTKPQTKDCMLHVRIDRDLFDWLKERAGRESIGTVLRPMIRAHMEEDQKTKKPRQ